MKRVIFLYLLILSGIALFAQDIPQSYAPLLIREDSEAWRSGQFRYDSDATILPKGTRVTGRIAANSYIISHVSDYMATINYNNNHYAIRTSDLSPISGQLPNHWLTVSDTQRKWAISYYLDVLRSQNRDTFLNYEKPWIDYATAYIEYNVSVGSIPDDRTWYNSSPFNLESLVFFDAVIIMGGFALCEFFITEVIPFNTGCKITMIGDYWFIEGQNFSWHGTRLPFPNWSERQSFDMIFIPDGDYMDVYLDTIDNKFATFARVDNVILEELEKLIHTNKVDLTRISSWPRRADGSTDYSTPPITSVLEEDKQSELIELSVDSSDAESQQTVQNSAKASVMPLWARLAIIGGVVVVAGGAVVFMIKRRK